MNACITGRSRRPRTPWAHGGALRSLLLAVTAAIAAACGPEVREDAGARRPADVQTGDTAVAGEEPATAWQECTNVRSGAVVEFPAGWRTNDGSVVPACTVFDPQHVDVPPASEMPAEIAVVIDVEELPFDEVAGSTFAIEEVEREMREVAGRRAVRRLVAHTGEGLWDRGMRSFEYIVDWSEGSTLIARTNDVGVPAFAEKRRVLDQMMERLRAAR